MCYLSVAFGILIMSNDCLNTDEQLVALLSTSDQIAFTKIYDRYWKLLFVSANNILQQKDTAKDIVQDVFLSLWKRRSEVQIESLEGWLLQAVRFQVFKAIRAEKASDDFYTRLSLVSKEIMNQDPVLYKELQNAVLRAMGALPADQQCIFNMNRELGMTYKQIAVAKNISVKTVEKKMTLVLRHLRGAFDKGILVFFSVLTWAIF
jgi:RNA polymerase sigma-70 factor (family 1)